MPCDWGYRATGAWTGKGVPARVLTAHGDYYRVACAEGEGIARKKASAYHDNPDAVPPVTGDFVRLDWNPHGESRILETLPRFSALERLDPSSRGYKAQTVAVNFDTLFFLMSVNENFSLARLERFLALAEDSGCRARAVLLLTKSDLLATPEEAAALLAQVREAAPDLVAHAISVQADRGLEAVRAYAEPGRTLAFVGSSGVGKSSLVNALAGEFLMDTCEIQEWSGKGRHTTTVRELVRLPCGAYVIDTPGMRELGLVGEVRTRFHSSGTHRYR